MSTNDTARFAAARPDFAAIAAWIPKGASVLDLGCGDGSLLRYLKETREVRGYGVEISDAEHRVLHPQWRERDPERSGIRAVRISKAIPSIS